MGGVKCSEILTTAMVIINLLDLLQAYCTRQDKLERTVSQSIKTQLDMLETARLSLELRDQTKERSVCCTRAPLGLPAGSTTTI